MSASRPFFSGRLELVLAKSDIELRSSQSKTAGRHRLVPVHVLQHPQHRRSFDRAEVRLRGRDRLWRQSECQMLRSDQAALAEYRRTFQGVVELADVSWPVMPEQCVTRVAGQTRGRPADRSPDGFEKRIPARPD